MVYTRHGHHIQGTTKDVENPKSVARCGGPALCRECYVDVERAHALRMEKEMTEQNIPSNAPINAPLTREVPTIGRIVLYILNEADVKSINKRRRDAEDKNPGEAENGVQIHVGNKVEAGDIFPMVVVRVWPRGLINGQVLLDGNDTLWVRSKAEWSDEVKQGAWAWPLRS